MAGLATTGSLSSSLYLSMDRYKKTGLARCWPFELGFPSLQNPELVTSVHCDVYRLWHQQHLTKRVLDMYIGSVYHLVLICFRSGDNAVMGELNHSFCKF